jgi:hypothetical protein
MIGRFDFRPGSLDPDFSARQSWNGPEQLFTWLDKMPLQLTERLPFVRGSNWSR